MRSSALQMRFVKK